MINSTFLAGAFLGHALCSGYLGLSSEQLLPLKNMVDKKGPHFTQIFRIQSIYSSHGKCRSMSPPLLRVSNIQLCLVDRLNHWNTGRLREEGEEEDRMKIWDSQVLCSVLFWLLGTDTNDQIFRMCWGGYKSTQAPAFQL